MSIKNIGNKRIKVTFDSNITLSVKYKTTLRSIANEIYTDEELKKIYGFRVNNEVRSFDEPLVMDSYITPITLEEDDGFRIYSRTVKYILKMALKKLYPDMIVDICNTIDNNIYFIVKGREFTNDLAVEILKEMRTISERSSIIERKVVSYFELNSLYKEQKDLKKLASINTRINPYSSMYFCEDCCDTLNGVIAPSTSYAKDFDIKTFRKGFLLVLKAKAKVVIDEKPKENRIYSLYEANNDFLDSIGVYSVNDLNENIVDGKISEIVKVAEASQANEMSKLVNKILKTEKLRIILIAGPSSSGKTTFAHKLGINLKLIHKNPVTISMDDFFKERVDTPKQKNGEYDFETVEALDLELFNSCMEKLLKGKEVDIPQFNFYTGEKEYLGKKMRLKENDVLIIEGIHALNPRICSNITEEEKFRIYLAPMTSLNINDFSKVSTTDTRMIRRIVRDYKQRGHDVQKTLKMWSNIVKGENENIYPYINTADYIFNTSLVYELGVLKAYAEPLLLQVKNTNEYFSETRRLYDFLKIFLAISVNEVPNDSLLNEFIGD